MTRVIVLNRTNCALGLCSSFFLFCLLTAAVPLRAQTSATPAVTTTPASSAPPPQPATAPEAPAASTQPAAAPQVTTPAAPEQPGTQPATSSTQQPSAQQPGTQPAPNPDQPTPTIKVQVNEVNLIFTVTDKHGKFVTGLKQENFGLLDNQRPPEAVLRFQQQTNLPLRVGIMLDTSSSIRQRFQFEQDSAIEFLLQILHRGDRAFVEGFDIQTDLAQDFTNNVDLLNQGIRKLRPGGGTALFDALYKTCKDQMLTLQETGAVRRALILVSDGDDNYSRVQESDAIKMCQRADTIVYTISTNISPSKDKGDDVLKQISEATGGQPFYPIKLEDVAIGFRNIEEELRSQYHLVYRPANLKMDGSFRTIYLQATDPRYHVRAQKGYFAPRPLQ
ncbi:MAG TPA: VWA domain-containing protein [Edaphobacter sp.]|jgi:VWFA-related protein